MAKELIDTAYAGRFLGEVTLINPTEAEVLELHMVACRLLRQLEREREERNGDGDDMETRAGLR